MARKLYVAYDLDGGDLIGAIWAESRLKALDYFFSRPPLMPDQSDRLYLEPIEESDWTIQELAEIDPEIAEDDNYGFICDAYDSDIDIDRLIGRFNESRKPKHFSDALFIDLELPSKLAQQTLDSLKENWEEFNFEAYNSDDVVTVVIVDKRFDPLFKKDHKESLSRNNVKVDGHYLNGVVVTGKVCDIIQVCDECHVMNPHKIFI